MKEEMKKDPDKNEKANQKEKIALVEEQLSVEKEKVETGKVRISKKVIEEDVPLDLTAFEEEIEIDVKKIGQVVDKPGKAVRTEGDSTVYSVYREEYVKQTILEEEVWVTRKSTEKTFGVPGKIRREEINIERNPAKEKRDR